ncbi:MAG: hypothetical protein NVS3B20_26750 [Polyangiales bacterium]
MVAACLLTATFVATPIVLAESAPVAVGEISTSVGHEEVVPILRTALATQLANVKIPAGKKFIVSASLTKLETKNNGSETTTSCVVSIALREAKSGNLRGMVQGTSAAVGAAGTSMNADLISAAVHGAAGGVSQMLAQ